MKKNGLKICKTFAAGYLIFTQHKKLRKIRDVIWFYSTANPFSVRQCLHFVFDQSKRESILR